MCFSINVDLAFENVRVAFPFSHIFTFHFHFHYIALNQLNRICVLQMNSSIHFEDPLVSIQLLNAMDQENNWEERTFRRLDMEGVEILSTEFLMAEKRTGNFLHTISEKQLYTATTFGIYGKVYRCQNRKCPARVVMLPNGQCVRLPIAKNHSHEYDCEERVKKLRALSAMKKKCADLQRVASGRRLAKVKDIFTEVMIE